MSRATALGALKKNDNRKKRRSLISTGASETDLKQCADRNLGTKFRKRGNPLYLAIHGRPSPALPLPPSNLRKRPNLARLSESAVSFQIGFSRTWGSPVASRSWVKA